MKQPSTSLKEPAHSMLQYPLSKVFTDQATKDKIQRHLNDINDVITEEDIRNIDTRITLKQTSSTVSA